MSCRISTLSSQIGIRGHFLFTTNSRSLNKVKKQEETKKRKRKRFDSRIRVPAALCASCIRHKLIMAQFNAKTAYLNEKVKSRLGYRVEITKTWNLNYNLFFAFRLSNMQTKNYVPILGCSSCAPFFFIIYELRKLKKPLRRVLSSLVIQDSEFS